MTLPHPCLTLVTDRRLCGGADKLVEAVEAAVEAGVDIVQLREKDLAMSELVPLAHRLRAATEGRALFVVNGPLDLALEVEADGVHLPEAAPAVRRPRESFLVGRSVHSPAAARRASDEGADYLIAGPVFETPSHAGRAPAGTGLISEIASAVACDVLAIGGITPARVDSVVRAGASGVAVISAVLAARDPGAAAREMRRALDVAWATRGLPAPPPEAAPIEYVPFAREHLEGIVRMAEVEEYPSYMDAERALRALTAPGVTAVVALEGERVVGFAQMQSDGEIQAHLSMVLVDRGARRRGIGRRLVGEAFARGGGTRVDLISTEGADAFYRSFQHQEFPGFRIYPER